MWKHWQEKDPFADSRGGGFFYVTPALSDRLSRMRALLDRGEGPVVLVGGQGAGKTTLMDRVLAETDGRWRTRRIDGGTAALEAGMERLLPGDSPSARPHADTLLVVDDADRLAPDTLHSLMGRCRAACAGRVPLVLCGTPGLLKSLSRARPGAGTEYHALEVPALDEPQVADYIHGRLRRARHSGVDPFTDEVVHWIAGLSLGRPGRVNVLAREVMAGAGFPATRGSAPAWVAPVAVAAVVVTGISVGYRMSSPGVGRGTDRTVVELPLPPPVRAMRTLSVAPGTLSGEGKSAIRYAGDAQAARRARAAARLLLLLRMSVARGKAP